MLRKSLEEIKVIATKNSQFGGYELRFKDVKSNAELYASELPEHLFKFLNSKRWAYKHGEKYFFNIKSTKKDADYFAKGSYIKDFEEYLNKAPKTAKTATTTKTASSKNTKKAEPSGYQFLAKQTYYERLKAEQEEKASKDTKKETPKAVKKAVKKTSAPKTEKPKTETVKPSKAEILAKITEMQAGINELMLALVEE